MSGAPGYAARVQLTQEPAWLSRLLSPVTEVRRGEAITALLLTLNVFLLLTAYYVIKPVREAMILALDSGAEYKSYMSGVIAVALLVAVPAYARFVDKLPRSRLVVGVTLFFALHLLLFFAASGSTSLRDGMGLVFYVWVGIFNMMVVAQFWAFANDLYTEERGKRLFPLVALGASIGAAVGSKVAALLIPSLGLYPMLLAGCVLLVACAGLFWWIDLRERAIGSVSPPAAQPEPQLAAAGASGGAFQMVLRNRYLLLLALFSLVFSWANTNGEYMLGKVVKAAASAAVARGEIAAADQGAYIGATYGDFFFYVNIAGVFLQAFVVSRLIRSIGFGAAFLLMPVLVFGNALLIASLPVLAIVRIGKIAENATDYSLNNTLRQMLWLSTTHEQKYKAKQAVDTFFVRAGDVSSALLIYAGVAWLSWAIPQFAIANAVLAVVWLGVAVLIIREQRRVSARARAAAAEAQGLGESPAAGRSSPAS